MSSPDHDDLITEREAAKLIGVDPRTLAARGPAYGLKPYQPLGIERRRYRRSDVMAYIASITPKPIGDGSAA